VKPWTPEHHAKMQAVWTPERRAMAVIQGQDDEWRGSTPHLPWTPEHRAKIMALWTPERRAVAAERSRKQQEKP